MSHSSLFIVAAASLFLIHVVDAGQDLTRTPGSSGTDVVEASVALVEESGVFPTDNQFLRRLAWVESQDGQGKDTYRSGYFGGIWQVDETVLLVTQNVADYPGLTSMLKSLQMPLGIEWSSVQKEDLLKPLYSALAARIFTWTVSDVIPLASDIQGQALYWQKHYRVNGAVDVFVQLVQELESMEGEQQWVYFCVYTLWLVLFLDCLVLFNLDCFSRREYVHRNLYAEPTFLSFSQLLCLALEIYQEAVEVLHQVQE